MGNWGYNPTYRGPITPLITGRGPPCVNHFSDTGMFFPIEAMIKGTEGYCKLYLPKLELYFFGGGIYFDWLPIKPLLNSSGGNFRKEFPEKKTLNLVGG